MGNLLSGQQLDTSALREMLDRPGTLPPVIYSLLTHSS
jgi:hypothetical protein